MDQGGDVPQLAGHAGSRYHRSCPAIGDQRSHVEHVSPVTQGQILFTERSGIFFHRFRLPCKGGLLHLQIGGFDDPAVRRNEISRFDQNDIPTDQFPRSDFLHLGIPENPDLGGRQTLQRCQSFLGPVLLPETQQGVEDNDHQDDQGVLPLSEHDPGYRCCGDEQQYHERGELLGEDAKGRLGSPFNELVRPVFLESLTCRLSTESSIGAHAQMGQYRGGIKGVPG